MQISKLWVPMRRSMSLRQGILKSNLVQEYSRLRFALAGVACAAILMICTLCSSTLSAQADPCDATILQPLPPPAPLPCTMPKKPSNVADDTKSALACAWIAPSGPEPLLEALRILTSSSVAYGANQRVFVELTAASPGNDYLFRAAMGDFDQHGQPTVQGLPDLLDSLAKANTLPKPSDENKTSYKIALSACTQDIVNDLFATPSGPLVVARINDSFARKNKYVALYQLLDAVWQQNDAQHIEKLRAAFDANADDLANQVGLKINSAK
jgi:hypothetical protein